MSALRTLERLGVRVLPCRDLGREAVYFNRFSLFVVDEDLEPERLEELARWAVGRVQEHAPQPRRRLDALCCECGTVRTVSRSRVGATLGAAEDTSGVTKPYRCNHCAGMTMHAIVAAL